LKITSLTKRSLAFYPRQLFGFNDNGCGILKLDAVVAVWRKCEENKKIVAKLCKAVDNPPKEFRVVL
jgi:predicted DCC family thiol-disulfide oxidoreductase YuxK